MTEITLSEVKLESTIQMKPYVVPVALEAASYGESAAAMQIVERMPKMVYVGKDESGESAVFDLPTEICNGSSVRLYCDGLAAWILHVGEVTVRGKCHRISSYKLI